MISVDIRGVKPYVYVKNLSWDDILNMVQITDVEGDQARRILYYASNNDTVVSELSPGKVLFPLEDVDLLSPILTAANREEIILDYFIVYVIPEINKIAGINNIDEIVLQMWLKDNPKRFPDFVIKELPEFEKGVLGIDLKYSLVSVLAAIRWLENLYNFIHYNSMKEERVKVF